jgi:hypothetical protein
LADAPDRRLTRVPLRAVHRARETHGSLAADGRLFLATDNDSVEDDYGETLFFRLSGH